MPQPTLSKRKNYGNTWWGTEWIEAIEAFGDDRLKRGKTYANTGRVKDIKIVNGVCRARVSGNYQPYYNVRLELEALKPEQQELIKTIIQDSPSLTNELVRGILPQVFLDLCKENDVKLLPRSWKDFKATCSCPDWGDPCKHQAATCYMLAAEIDKDPLLLLRLRGLSLEDLKLESMTSINHTLRLEELAAGLAVTKIVKPKPELENDAYDILIEQIFFSSAKSVNLISLLAKQPPFFNQGDFKIILEQQIACLIGIASGFKVHEDLDDNLKYHAVKYTVNTEAKSVSELVDFEKYKHDDLFKQLLAYPLNSDLKHMHPSFRFHMLLMHFALKMVAKGLFVPEPVVEARGTFVIYYKAKLSSVEIKQQLKILEDSFATEANTLELLHYYVNFIVRQIFATKASVFKQMLKAMPKGYLVERLIKLFIGSESFAPEHYSEKNIQVSVSNWLERLHISSGSYLPIVKFNLQKDKFFLSLDIKASSTTLPIQPYAVWIEHASKDEIAIINRQLSVVADYIPAIKQIIDSKGKDLVQIDLRRVSDILLEIKPVLDFLGLEFVFPKEFVNLLKPKISLKVNSSNTKISLLNMGEMLDFSYQVSIGDQVIDAKEFATLLTNAKGLIKFQDQFVFVDPNEINKMLDKLNKPILEIKSSNEALFTILAGEYDGVAIDDDKQFKRLYEFITQEEPVKVPLTLKARLRPYQERGFRWLYTNCQKKLGSCIADDMGLGKTLQVIALILALKQKKNNKAAMVVCPTTLIGNWSKECARFAPSLKVGIYHGNSRKQNELADCDIMLTSYGTIRRDYKKLAEQEWGLLIIDEAQNIKNTETQQTKAIKSIKAANYIAMTGTPVENRLSELWSIMDFANRGYLGDLNSFNKNFANPIEGTRDFEAIKKLRMVSSPFLLRRLKTDKTIIGDLPSKIVSDDYCNLTKEQAALYKAYTDKIMESIEESEGIERKGLIFKLITTLKQICNHPCNFTKEKQASLEQSGKALQLIELSQNILALNEKLIIFTQYTEMGNILVKLFADALGETVLFFHGGLSRKHRDAMVESFQNELQNKIMIISLKAGGVGLNLTAANHVIHYDLWWNPAVENQATDRAFRIGQKKNVMVHRLITMGTFEEKINEIIKSKQELAELSVGEGENWINKLSDKELKEVFMLRQS